MKDEQIKCPKCGSAITIDQAIVQRMVDFKSEKLLGQEKLKWEEEKRKEQDRTNKLLQEKLAFESQKREEAEKKELLLIRKQAEMEDEIKHQELTLARKIQTERQTIIDKAQAEWREKYNLQSAELRKQLEDTKKALGEAQRKAQQGSMQTQGEVMELALEELLKRNFPQDDIDPVPKGVTGADLVQRVCLKTGQECGMIVWESKQTKAWTEDWVQKLKDDGRNIKANILILVSEIMPKPVRNFGLYKGIWVCDFASILGLTTALRNQLIATTKAVASQINKEEKKDILYDYLCSPTFANRIQTIAENFLAMKNTLEKEKMAMTKMWSSREIQINRMMENTAKMYGEISGYVGNQLPTIELLELKSAKPELKTPENQPENKKDETSPNEQTGLF